MPRRETTEMPTVTPSSPVVVSSPIAFKLAPVSIVSLSSLLGPVLTGSPIDKAGKVLVILPSFLLVAKMYQRLFHMCGIASPQDCSICPAVFKMFFGPCYMILLAIHICNNRHSHSIQYICDCQLILRVTATITAFRSLACCRSECGEAAALRVHMHVIHSIRRGFWLVPSSLCDARL